MNDETQRTDRLHPRRAMEVFSFALLLTATLSIFAPVKAKAAELILFERAGCAWCATFDREIAPIYGKTDEGRRAPLRRVDLDAPLPQDLAFVEIERLSPLFVLVDKGREIGRIRGYPGEDNFWGLLGVLVKKLDDPGAVSELLGHPLFCGIV